MSRYDALTAHLSHRVRGKGLRAALLTTVASTALLCLGNNRVFAQACAPLNPGEGGTVTCSGGFIPGGYIAPPNTGLTVNVLNGTTVQGAGVGIQISGTGNSTINNSGTIQDGTAAVRFDGAAGFSKTLNNNGSINGNIVGTGNGVIVINQNGNLNGGITITGTGQNTINLPSGRNINGAVNIAGTSNTVDSFGIFNQGLIISGNGTNTVTIHTGSQVNQTFTITGSGTNTVDNSGIFNNGIGLNGNGTNTVFNRAGATINQDLTSTGSARDFVDNMGTINNNVRLNDGDDVYINRNAADANPVGPREIQNGVVDLGPGADVFLMLGGRVNNQVLLGPGADDATISGGVITQFVRAEDGDDRLLWTGGNIGGLDMGAGNDVATFRNLTSTHLTPGLRIDGSLGFDRLVWDNTAGDGAERYVQWELFELTNNSRFTFTSTLTLGDPGTGTGTLSIDSTSTVFAGNGTHTVAPFTAGLLVTVINAGTIDLTNGGANPNDRFVVMGHYVGSGGRLNLQTVLGNDSSPSDRLVISGAGATATGSTTINVTNLGGFGALTTGDGIRVVGTAGGATTAAGAFALPAPIAAGIYEYQLFRGGVTAGTANDWFLRSHIPGPTPIPPDPPDPTPPTPDPGPTPPPDPPAPTPRPSIPIIRPEIPGYMIAPAMAREVGLAAIGTFHDRRGDQSLLAGQGVARSAWLRVFGGTQKQATGVPIPGTSFVLAPEFSGHVWGVQVGLDLWAVDRPTGQDRFGVFYTHTGASGDTIGNTLALFRNASGELKTNGDSVGVYWTHIGHTGWYTDAVALHTWLGGSSSSRRGIGANINGTALGVSLEGGYPIPVNAGWRLEPQAQLIWQRVDLDDTADRFSRIGYGATDSFAARFGVRLEGTMRLGAIAYQPHFGVNVWHNFSGDYAVVFNTLPVTTNGSGTSLELVTGVVATLTANVSAYAQVSYATNLNDELRRTLGGRFGMRVRW